MPRRVVAISRGDILPLSLSVPIKLLFPEAVSLRALERFRVRQNFGQKNLQLLTNSEYQKIELFAPDPPIGRKRALPVQKSGAQAPLFQRAARQTAFLPRLLPGEVVKECLVGPESRPWRKRICGLPLSQPFNEGLDLTAAAIGLLAHHSDLTALQRAMPASIQHVAGQPTYQTTLEAGQAPGPLNGAFRVLRTL